MTAFWHRLSGAPARAITPEFGGVSPSYQLRRRRDTSSLRASWTQATFAGRKLEEAGAPRMRTNEGSPIWNATWKQFRRARISAHVPTRRLRHQDRKA